MTVELDDISQADFLAYEEVRVSGVTNMMSPDVRDLAGIDRDTHLGIMKHYSELCAKWPAIRSLEES